MFDDDSAGGPPLGPDVVPFPARRALCVLRPPEVCERVALSPTHVYRLIAEGRFPRFVAVGLRASALLEHVLDAFIAERMAARERLPRLGFRSPLPVWRFEPSKVPAQRGIRLMRRADVLALAGVSKSSLYRFVEEGRFPAPVPLGPCATRWVAHEVSAWLRALAA